LRDCDAGWIAGGNWGRTCGITKVGGEVTPNSDMLTEVADKRSLKSGEGCVVVSESGVGSENDAATV